MIQHVMMMIIKYTYFTPHLLHHIDHPQRRRQRKSSGPISSTPWGVASAKTKDSQYLLVSMERKRNQLLFVEYTWSSSRRRRRNIHCSVMNQPEVKAHRWIYRTNRCHISRCGRQGAFIPWCGRMGRGWEIYSTGQFKLNSFICHSLWVIVSPVIRIDIRYNGIL